MIIACPACATRYVVPDSAIGVEGRTVRCAKCRHSWFQDGPEITVPAAAPPPEPEAEVPTEVLAEAIVAISQGIKKLRTGRFNDDALCMLIAYAAPTMKGSGKPSKREVRAVLDGIEALERTYLKKTPRP